MKLGLALLYENRLGDMLRAPILAVHDEIVIEVGAENAKDAAIWLEQHMKQGMQEVLSDRVPVVVDTKIGETWEKK
jgi:DNA polymerase I-like protein with 3'-5' exonuclease and polymerase domains